jgi:precorrin-2 dehydrogenase/sirohydrochlorin ferrochelatase
VIPLFHDFTDRRVLVFGGGHVGARKARRFAREANVVVFSPAFTDADFGRSDLVRVAPAPDAVGGWLDRVAPALVVAATDDGALNARIEAEARARDVLVNRTDTHGGRDPGSVVVPATVRDGDVVAAVSTGGASPALSKHLRERIEGELEGAGAMAALTGELRDRLQREAVPPEDRRAAVRAVVRNDRVWKLLGTGPSKARQEADAVVDRVVGEEP